MKNSEELNAALQKCKLDDNELEAVSGGFTITLGNGGNNCAALRAFENGPCTFPAEYKTAWGCNGCPKY